MAFHVRDTDPSRLHAVNDILDGIGYYGTCKIELRPIGISVTDGRLYKVGDAGITASVGQMIRTIWSRRNEPVTDVRSATRFLVPVSHNGHQIGNDVYYAISIGSGLDADISTYLVGGCTDFSGEGGKGKMLMDTFIVEVLKVEMPDRGPNVLVEMLLHSID